MPFGAGTANLPGTKRATAGRPRRSRNSPRISGCLSSEFHLVAEVAETNADALPTNPELRTALERFVQSGGDAKNQDAVFRALLGATLIFPSVSSGPGKISLAFIKEQNGDLLTPAFTDAQALLAWAPSG